MGIRDELKAEEKKLRGIRAPNGEGNRYNTPAGRRKLAERVRDAGAASGGRRGGQGRKRGE